MDAFTFTCRVENQIVIIENSGYFEVIAGNTVTKEIVNHLKNGKKLFLLDFAKVRVINSPGVSAIMYIALKIQDDFKGKILLTGLDKFKKTVLKMAGVIPIADCAETIEEGIALFSKTQA
ncbi:MAG: STAS domain-containing protein [Candidatus Riflebacteria bacterium]|nr:STAS domain-containing protein [Candidatus Riflebacteria bacterium]